MSKVFVLDTNKQPLNPVHPGRARILLNSGAAVNTTRWELFRRLQDVGLPVECGSGGLTKRTTGSFNITTKQGTVQGISYKYCQAVHRMDGYRYQVGEGTLVPKPLERKTSFLPEALGQGFPEVAV